MIIFLSGKQGAGKDTVANALQKMIPLMKRASIAGELKKQVAEQLGLSLDELEQQKNDKAEVRQVLIDVGEKARQTDPHVWIRTMLENNPGHLIVSDLRFASEVDYIKENLHVAEYLIVRVEADKETRATRRHISHEDHPSETELDKFNCDYYIQNGTGVEMHMLLKDVSMLARLIYMADPDLAMKMVEFPLIP